MKVKPFRNALSSAFLSFSLLYPSTAFNKPADNTESAEGQQTACTTAKDCFEKGAAEYQRGEYETALEFFRHSYRQADERRIRNDLLFNIARSYENLGRPSQAREHYQLYLAENPADANRQEVTHRMEALVTYARGKEFYHNKEYETAAEIFKKVYASIAPGGLRAALLYDIASSYEQARQNEIAADYYKLYLTEATVTPAAKRSLEEKVANLQRNLLPEEAVQQKVRTSQASAESRPQDISWWTAGFFGAGVLSLGAGTITGLAARAKYNDLYNSCADGGCSESEISGVGNLATTANVLFVTGALSLAISTGIYLYERK